MRKPDFEQILYVLNREKPERPTLFEFYMNDELYAKLAGSAAPNFSDILARSKWIVDAYRNAGYDYATTKVSRLFNFPKQVRKPGESVSLNEGSVINDEASLEKYLWPNVNEIDFSFLKELESYVPAGMKVIVPCAGPQETLIDLVGFDNLCFMFYENPELVRAIIDNIGARIAELFERVLEYPIVGSIICSDDWGHKTQTMFSPEIMKKYIFPWHKRIVGIAHEAGRPAILHSCGNLNEVMQDVIAIGYDAKHSFEDEIQPVEDAYSTYSSEIAILGGIDVDFLCRSSIETIKERSCNMLDIAKEGGGYALGSGNSIPDYMPDENYFAMISSALGKSVN